MTLENAVQNHIVTHGGPLVGNRVWQGAREQGEALPAITWDWIDGGESDQDMTAGSVGLGRRPIQINCIADTAQEAASIRATLRLAFQNHVNAVMGGAGGVHVWACYLAGYSGGFDPDTHDFVRSIDFEIHHEEALS